jgi:hypothetical protein
MRFRTSQKKSICSNGSIRNSTIDLAISGKYVADAFRTVAGTGTIPSQNKVNSNFIIDLSNITQVKSEPEVEHRQFNG